MERKERLPTRVNWKGRKSSHWKKRERGGEVLQRGNKSRKEMKQSHLEGRKGRKRRGKSEYRLQEAGNGGDEATGRKRRRGGGMERRNKAHEGNVAGQFREEEKRKLKGKERVNSGKREVENEGKKVIRGKEKDRWCCAGEIRAEKN